MKIKYGATAFLTACLVVGVVFVANVSAGALYLANDKGNATVEKNQVVNGAAYLAGNTVTVDGTVNGDLYCAGNSVAVRGTVSGDVLCAGNDVSIDGVVKGDVRVAGATVTLGGEVTGNATVAGSNVTASSSLKLGRDLTGGASTLKIDGEIGRDMTAGTSALVVNGTVGRNVESGFGSVAFGNEAKVGGDFSYSAQKEASVPTNVVAGETKFTMVEDGGQASVGQVSTFWGVGMAIAIAVVALLGAVVMPRQVHATASPTWGKFAAALTLGFVAVFMTPVATLLFFVTGIGAIAGYALVLMWLLLMALSPVFVAYFIGSRVYGSNSQNILVRSLAGAFVLVILLLIPGVNVASFLVMLFAGVGMVLMQVPKLYHGDAYQASKKPVVKAKKKTA